MTSIILKLQLPDPGNCQPDDTPERTIEDEIRDSIKLVESGRDSEVEWAALKKLYVALRTGKQTPQTKHICKMIQPLLNKYGYYTD